MIRQNHGFTIIEVVLFLAVSGMLTIGLLASASVAIQRQQYKDAVQSFAGYLRDEYAKVISVENDGSTICGGTPVDHRGQSDCFIVGRLIKTSGTAGQSYDSYPIYADGTVYKYDEGQKTTYGVNWGVKTKFAGMSDDVDATAFAMYRDPETGRLEIRSKIGADITNSPDPGGNGLTAFMEDTSADVVSKREICVYDRGWLQAERQSVFVAAQAGSGDAITVGAATEQCDD